jgi:hypothetical protein
MADEGSFGIGTWLRESQKAMKRAFTTTEAVQRQTVRATAKTTAPKADAPWWQPIWDYSPFGSKNKVTNPPAEAAASGLKSFWASLPDISGTVKWVVVGVVALAAIVLIPRLLPTK